MKKAKLHIIPIGISDAELNAAIPSFNTSVISGLRCFVVEKIRTARQFLRKLIPDFPIDDSVFFELDKHNNYEFPPELIKAIKEGNNIGLMSESGYPGIADPGAKVVAKAHSLGVEVLPMVGPSSILMALVSSGMNGNGFTFHGYLPKKDPALSTALKKLATEVSKSSFSQIFIETPYRNQLIFDQLIEGCPNSIRLCIAYDIMGENQQIKTLSIADWKSKRFNFDKKPCVFVLGV